MSSFDSQTFRVKGDRGLFPGPSWEADGWHYRATIRVDTLAEAQALLDRVSDVAVDPVYGSNPPAIFVHVHRGVGSKSLTVPRESGTAITYASAVLRSLALRPDGRVTGRYVFEADWLIRSPITP